LCAAKIDFARIVDDNQAMVVSLATRYLRDPDTAEEIAQDVFLQLYRQLDRIQTPEHARFWLRRAICHRSIDESRRRKLRPRLGLESIPEPPAETVAPDTMLNERLRRVVAALPDAARMVVLLRYQEDLDPSEIAMLLEMPVSTVKSHLHRSLAVLRSKLARTVTAQEACS
jgi:RNA polymerase sigma-70 factor (ECF subfamily)